LLALAVLLLAVAAFAIAAVLDLTWIGTVLAAFVIGFAEIVLVTEGLSLFHAVRPATYLLAEAAIAGAAVALWLRRGRPRPVTNLPAWSAVRAHPLLLALGSAVAIALAFELVLALITAPNTYDSMSYHLSRAAAWYQHDAYGHLHAHTARQNAYPPNAEMLTLFTMVFSNGDRFAALPQFISQLVLLAAIFGIALRIGFRRSEAAFASLIFATLSEVALEATTTQNDLVVAACVAAGTYFVLGKTQRESLLAALALALAVGTKLTGIWAVPVVLLVALGALPRRQVVQLAAATAVAFVFVASPVYAANERDYGSLLGPPSTHSKWESRGSEDAVTTFGRIFYRFIDFSGATYRPPDVEARFAASPYVPIALKAQPEPEYRTPSPFLWNGRANEDVSFFGPLGFLFILPAVFAYLVGWARSRVPRTLGLLALALPLYTALLALTYSHNPWVGRFMLIPVALVAPLLARGYRIQGLNAIAAGVGVLFLALALVHNERKPVGFGDRPVWNLSRAEVQALGEPTMAPALEAIDRIVPDPAKVGYLLRDDSWDYPLYGKDLARKLIPLPARDPLQAATRMRLRWVVIDNVSAKGSRDWMAVRFPGWGWSLLVPRSSPSAAQLVDLARTEPHQAQASRQLH
jgi:hypothetical protein